MKRAVIAMVLFAVSCATSAADSAALDSAVDAVLGKNAAFVRAVADLNHDSQPDAVVLARDSKWCGSGGCVMLIFQGTPHGYALISRSTISAPPVRVLPSAHLGWTDLIVHSNGTGNAVLQFKGSGYPSNPSLEPTPTSKQMRSSVEILAKAPNNSFKPNPLRSFKTPSGSSGGSA